MMRRQLAQELLLTGGRFRFVALFAHRWGFRVGEVPVEHEPRRHGFSKFGTERFPGALIDLIATTAFLRYHARPGHPFIEAGAVSGVLGFGICAYLAWRRLSTGSIEFRYPLLALGILLLAIGVQLVATGFLGEWLAHQLRRGEPGYRVGAVVEMGSTEDATSSGDSPVTGGGNSLVEGSRPAGSSKRGAQ